MDKEKSYIETLVENVSSDKNRLCALVFSILSAVCTILYMATSSMGGVHFVFIIALLLAAIANVYLLIDFENKSKYADNVAVFGVTAIVISLILKVSKIGISFSIIYFFGYLLYALTYLLLALYLTKNASKPKLIRMLLFVCAVWSLFEFFALSSAFIVGITWKIFRISEAFLSLAYLFLLNIVTKRESAFEETVWEYKKQIPSLKICIALLLIVSFLFLAIGFVIDMNKESVTNTVTEQEIKKTVEENKEKKSTVKSTVITTEENTKKSTIVSTTEPVDEVREIKLGDQIETDAYTFRLNKVELSHRVQPQNPPSYYTYYKAEPEHVYIYVNASITNKEKYALECDEIYSVTADFDGGYEYNGFNIADDSDGDFTYANITSIEPLSTLGVHCLVDCPQIVEEEGKSLFITITLSNGEKYKYIIK